MFENDVAPGTQTRNTSNAYDPKTERIGLRKQACTKHEDWAAAKG
jgi:hypothetical protein